MNTKTCAKTILVSCLLTATAFSLNWWNSDWQYRQKIKTPENISEIENQLIQLKINSTKLIEKNQLRNDCRDIRTVKDQKKLPLNIEGCGEEETTITTRLTEQENTSNENESNTTSGTANESTNKTLNNSHSNHKTLYIYYGNSKAPENNESLSLGYENRFEDNLTKPGAFNTYEDTWCDGPYYSCDNEGQYSASTANEEKATHYQLDSSVNQNFAMSNRVIHAESHLTITEPVFQKNRTGSMYLSTSREFTAYSNCWARGNYWIYITNGSAEKELLREKSEGRDTNSIGRIRYHAKNETITYSYVHGEDQEKLNNLTVDELKRKEYESSDKHNAHYDFYVNSVDVSNLDELKLKMRTASACVGGDGSTCNADANVKTYFIKREGALNTSLGPKASLPYHEAKLDRITPRRAIRNSDTRLPLEAWMNLENPGETDYSNISIPFNLTGLNKIYLANYSDIKASIGANKTKKISFPFEISLEVNETDLNELKGKDKLIKITNNFTHHIENISFSHEVKENWKDIKLYKCPFEDFHNCSSGNLSTWTRLSYRIENGSLLRKGDTMSALYYRLTYEVEEEDDSDSGSDGGGSGGGSSGGSGGSSGAVSSHVGSSTDSNKNEEVEENQSSEREEEIERSHVEILEPGREVNSSFEVKVKTVNDEECIVKLGESSWKQLQGFESPFTRHYSQVDSGEYDLTVKCLRNSVNKSIEVKNDEDKDLNLSSSRLTGESVVKTGYGSFPYAFAGLIGLSLFLFYFFRTRGVLSWVRRRMGR